ncbi:MAG TPA: hypothetical protein VMV27_03400 [Candidatus Binataceae bacterium]|nr:hypothetical protein [Candidatus Binataceae bacterium]
MPIPPTKHRRNGAVIIFGLLLGLLPLRAPVAQAQQYHVDQASSTALTKYLHRHRLPLVGGQVLRTDSGTPKLVLYGFVATQSGRGDAERKAERYLGLTDVPVTNSIQIKPSINASGASPGSGPGAPSQPAPNSNQQWNNAMEGIYKNGAQPLPSPGVPVLP